jgi:hypothetical protein
MYICSLDLKVEGNVKYDGNIFQTNNYARYRRSYLPLSTGEAHGKLFVSDRSLELEVKFTFFVNYRNEQ